MKLYKLLYGAMALTMLGACSDRDFIDGNDPNANQSQTQGKADGYMAIEIKLPQEVATRAEDAVDAEDDGAKNDNFNDGTPDEYYVDNALIAIFKGANENDAVFYRAQELTKPFFSNLSDGVSASYIAAIPASREANDKSQYWALVVLNNNGETTKIESPDDKGNERISLGGTILTAGDAVNSTFSKVKEITTEKLFISKNKKENKNRFFMINAPMADKKGGEFGTTGKISYMTPLSTTIYDTPDEAKNNVSGCVYVERAMAKVTCQEFNNSKIGFTIIDENGNEVKESDLTGWNISADVTYALSNTSKKSYLLRNVDFTSDNHFSWDFVNGGKYRFIGTTPIPALSDPFHQEEKNLYRTYWCRDPHYSTSMGEGDKEVVDENTTFLGLDQISYCKENTFMVQNQNYNNTTLAIFKIKYTIGKKNQQAAKHLFVRDGNNSKVYLTEETAYADGVSRIVNSQQVKDAITKALAPEKTLPADNNVRDYITIEFEIPENEGTKPEAKYLVISDIKLNTTGKGKDLFDANSAKKFDDALEENNYKTSLLDRVNAMTDVTVFEDCVSYYAVPIKHFGDYYTPWNKDENKGTTTNEVYDKGNNFATKDHAQKYLGRYGMVRNNWYELNISKILGLGNPIIPDSNISTSDDNNEDKKYFSVEIHILSWAKRLQDIEL